MKTLTCFDIEEGTARQLDLSKGFRVSLGGQEYRSITVFVRTPGEEDVVGFPVEFDTSVREGQEREAVLMAVNDYLTSVSSPLLDSRIRIVVRKRRTPLPNLSPLDAHGRGVFELVFGLPSGGWADAYSTVQQYGITPRQVSHD